MSCGKYHETPCHEVLQRVYLFLDREMDTGLTYEAIEQHLRECGPCLTEFDFERVVRAVVQRSMNNEHAPDRLRAKILARIHELRIEITEV
jgi:mycothiol system anti-sigma-R factor